MKFCKLYLIAAAPSATPNATNVTDEKSERNLARARKKEKPHKNNNKKKEK